MSEPAASAQVLFAIRCPRPALPKLCCVDLPEIANSPASLGVEARKYDQVRGNDAVIMDQAPDEWGLGAMETGDDCMDENKKRTLTSPWRVDGTEAREQRWRLLGHETLFLLVPGAWCQNGMGGGPQLLAERREADWRRFTMRLERRERLGSLSRGGLDWCRYPTSARWGLWEESGGGRRRW